MEAVCFQFCHIHTHTQNIHWCSVVRLFSFQIYTWLYANWQIGVFKNINALTRSLFVSFKYGFLSCIQPTYWNCKLWTNWKSVSCDTYIPFIFGQQTFARLIRLLIEMWWKLQKRLGKCNKSSLIWRWGRTKKKPIDHINVRKIQQ